MNPTQKALQMAKKMGTPIKGTTFDPQKPTLVLQRKAIPPVVPFYKDKDGKYYKTPIV